MQIKQIGARIKNYPLLSIVAIKANNAKFLQNKALW